MGRELGQFSWRVIDQIQKAIDEQGFTDAEVIQRAGMRRTTFYVKMRGESAMTTEDIASLAAALGKDPALILKEAALSIVGGGGEDDDLPLKSTDEVRAQLRKRDVAPAAKRGPRREEQ